MMPSIISNTIVVFILVFVPNILSDYVVPAARFDILQPRGFEVSIPDSEGVELFAFHGNLNEELADRDAGYWSKDIIKPKNGRYTFRDLMTKLKEGDVIHYWLNVHHRGRGYQVDGEFTVSSVVCADSATQVVMGIPCHDTLIFEENFDTFDSAKWRLEQRFSKAPDHEFAIYMNHSDALSVKSGMLTLQPVRLDENTTVASIDFGDKCTGRRSTDECQLPADRIPSIAPIASAQISTINSFSFIYGRVDIRAQLPNAKWVFPQIFLQPTDSVYGADGYASGQMRMAYATAGESMIGGVLLGSEPPFRHLKMCRYNGQWSDEFHLFSLRWMPDEISVSIDGSLYCVLRAPIYDASVNGRRPPAAMRWVAEGGHMAPFDRPFHLVLGVGVGGVNDFFDHPNRPKPWRNDDPQGMSSFWRGVKDTEWPGQSAQLKIDYIRVYSL